VRVGLQAIAFSVAAIRRSVILPRECSLQTGLYSTVLWDASVRGYQWGFQAAAAFHTPHHTTPHHTTKTLLIAF
jgi:hypothetical protein